MYVLTTAVDFIIPYYTLESCSKILYKDETSEYYTYYIFLSLFQFLWMEVIVSHKIHTYYKMSFPLGCYLTGERNTVSYRT